jgi:hexosaminidase
MGVKKRDIQRRWWRISIGTIVLLGIVLLFNNRSVIGLEGESCREWASVGDLIPPVVAFEFDSSEWNPIEEVNYELDPNLESEAYRIVSNEDGIKVLHGDKGDYRARSTFKQLSLLGNDPVLPWGTIDDRPAFRHRGVLMDVCRHFFTVDEVKRHLDVMALYKFNVLH